MTATPKTSAAGAPLLVLAGMMTLGLTDNALRLVTVESSLWQFHLLRSLCALLMICGVAACGIGTVRPNNVAAVFGRSILVALSMLIYFGCLAVLPIGVVIAGLFTAPLFVVLISVFVLGQPVGVIRWLAVVIGFVGAVLVIQPDPAALDFIAFLPILAGLLYACGAVATRAWCEGEGTLSLTAGFFLLLGVFGAIGSLVFPDTAQGAAGFALRGWMPLTQSTVIWTAVQSIGALIGIAFLVRAYQGGEASFVAVFEYSLLIFASVWAYILWGETVSTVALFGMVLIAGAGGIIAMRTTS